MRGRVEKETKERKGGYRRTWRTAFADEFDEWAAVLFDRLAEDTG